MKVKKVPMRMCNGCLEMKTKKELIRVVKDKDNNISVDLTGKMAGRGAYVCKDTKCLEAAFKAKRLNRNLSSNIDVEIYERLKEEIVNEK